MKVFIKCLAIAFALALGASGSNASTVVVNGDEWTLSDQGQSAAGAANFQQFVTNLVAEFGTSIYAYSDNFSFNQSGLDSAMSAAGATYTAGTGISFDLATLSGYDAIFLGGTLLTSAQEAVLTQYVLGGGNIYLAAGTACGGDCDAAEEAAAWNDFLLQFNIQLDPVYGFGEAVLPVGGDAIFAGVSDLYFNGVNTMTLSGNVVCCDAAPIVAVYRTAEVPLPAGFPLLAGGIALLAAARGRFRRR